jgi:UDP-N-acetylmuramoylalanine-D-glutamate ligase
LKKVVIVGATKTGISIHKILESMEIPHFIVDTREGITFDLTNSKFLISLKLGMDNTHQAIKEADELYFSPGFNRSRLIVDESKIKSELNLFLDNSSNFLIGVTGTNGKSTVCYLISQLLDSLNIPNKIIGNFGEPMLDSIHLKDAGLVLIVELSSFQLKDSSYDNISRDSGLDIGIFTNFSEDHLDNH